MIIDDLQSYGADVITADIVIVGSGAVGIPMALKFEKKGKNILVLESGGRKPNRFGDQLSQGQNTGELFLDLNNSRARCLGGASTIWAGVCRPHAPVDFEKKSYVELSGWPIQYADVQPYHVETARFLGLEYDRFSSTSWTKEFSSGQHFSEFVSPSSKVEGRIFERLNEKQRDFSSRFGQDLENSKKIKVLLNTSVLHLQLSENGQTIKHLVVSSPEKKRCLVRANKYILSCGALENPRILLLSNDVIKSGIGNQSQLLGKCFMSHPGFSNLGEIVLKKNDRCSDKLVVHNELSRLTHAFTGKYIREMGLLSHSIILEGKSESLLTPLRAFKNQWRSWGDKCISSEKTNGKY